MIFHAIGYDFVKIGSYLLQIITRKEDQYFKYMCGKYMHNWEFITYNVVKIIENVFPNLIAFNIIFIFYIFGVKPIEVIHNEDEDEKGILVISTYSDER